MFVKAINIREEIKVYKQNYLVKRQALLVLSEQGLLPLQQLLAKYALELIYLDLEVKHISAQVKLGKVVFTKEILGHCRSTAMLLVLIGLRAAQCYAYKYDHDDSIELRWEIAEALVIRAYGELPRGWDTIKCTFLDSAAYSWDDLPEYMYNKQRFMLP